MARKSEKDLSLLKRGLIKSCLGGVAPGKKRRGREREDEDDGGEEGGERAERRPAKAVQPKGYADSVMGKR